MRVLSPRFEAIFPSADRGVFERDDRAARDYRLVEYEVEFPALAFENPEAATDPARLQNLFRAPRVGGVRVGGSDENARDFGRGYGVAARARSAGRAARFERDVQIRALRRLRRAFKAFDFRVRPAVARVPALAYNAAVPDENRPPPWGLGKSSPTRARRARARGA